MKALKKIKLTFPYPDWPIERQLPKRSLVLGEYQFFINDQSCKHPDYWVIFEGLMHTEKATCHKDHTFFFTAEPPSFKQYDHDFLQQFGHIVTCQKSIKHPNIHYFHQGHPWFVDKSYNELISIHSLPKSKNISVITSDKQITDGHKKRYEFCHRLKEHFGNDLDLYGRGIQDFDDKWDVLAPYRYSIAIENEFLDDWFTEKLYDCFLALTVPVYYGCPNIDRYFDPNSMCRMDIDNFDVSKRQIENLLENHTYEVYLPKVKMARSKYLNEYNLFYLILNLLAKNTSERKDELLRLQPETEWTQPKKNLLHKLKSFHGSVFK